MRFKVSLFLLSNLFVALFFESSFVCAASDAQPLSQQVTHQKSKIIFGYIEHATLVDKSLKLPAKLDTGAQSASLYAKHIRYVDVNGKLFLHFVVPTRSGDVPFTCAYVGDVNIKARSGEVAGIKIKKPMVKRPMVNMRVQLGHETHTIRVNLANRHRFKYPLLLGREALVQFNGLVDSSRMFVVTGEAL